MYSSSKCLDCTPDKTQVVYTGVGKPLLFVLMNGSWYNVVAGGYFSVLAVPKWFTWFALSVRCHEELAMAVSLLLRCWQNSQGERTLGAFSFAKRWPPESPHRSACRLLSHTPTVLTRVLGARQALRSSKAYLRLNLARPFCLLDSASNKTRPFLPIAKKEYCDEIA